VEIPGATEACHRRDAGEPTDEMLDPATLVVDADQQAGTYPPDPCDEARHLGPVLDVATEQDDAAPPPLRAPAPVGHAQARARQVDDDRPARHGVSAMSGHRAPVAPRPPSPPARRTRAPHRTRPTARHAPPARAPRAGVRAPCAPPPPACRAGR